MTDAALPLQLRLDALPLGDTQLSASSDQFASRLIRLASGESLTLKPGQNDLLAVAGRGRIDTQEFSQGTYLSAGADAQIRAGVNGLTLFHFHRPDLEVRGMVLLRPSERTWRTGMTSGIGRCDLRVDDYKVALVEFAPGTHVLPHRHPRGEEVFILSGELHDAPEWMVPGDWCRLTQPEVHAPRSRVTTRILLFTGHLAANQAVD